MVISALLSENNDHIVLGLKKKKAIDKFHLDK